MTSAKLDFTSLFPPGLPPAAARWAGRVKHDFTGGNNDADALPLDGLIAAASAVMKREGRTLSTYGLNSGPQGYRALREFLVNKLTADAGIACSTDDILVTSGSLQGLDLVNATLLARGDTVIIEQDCYQGSINRLTRLGVTPVGIPLDSDGMRMDALANALDDLKRRGVRPKYIYTIPTVQNPTATVMSDARRRKILDLAGRHGVPVFEDECYSDLVWQGVRPPALRGIAGDDRVIHIGSFSKSIAPALRMGYLVADWPVMSRILAIKSDGGSGALEQMVLAEYCGEHFDAHVAALRKVLRRKAEALMFALKEEFGEAAQFDDPAGGIFLWVTLPAAVRTTRLAQAALEAGVAINPGGEWVSDPPIGEQRLRLCFAYPPEDIIREGVARLAEICHREFGIPVRGSRAHR